MLLSSRPTELRSNPRGYTTESAGFSERNRLLQFFEWNVVTMDDPVLGMVSAPPCLYPDEILAQYKLLEPKEYVTVRGRVAGLLPFEDKAVYGDLKGRDCSVSFCCPPDKSPTEMHQNVILGGYLTVKPSKFHTGLDIELRGEMLGAWEGISLDPTELLIPERVNKIKISLAAFVRDATQNEGGLLVIGSERGLYDFRQVSNLQVDEASVKMTDVDKFLMDARKAVQKHQPKAIAIVRGGSDTGKAMEMWNNARLIDWLLKTECLIYSAIGHADGYVFLDQYADQSFISPSDFGHCLKKAVEQRDREINLHKKYRQIDQENADLFQRFEDLQDEHKSELSAAATTYSGELASLRQSFEEKLRAKDQAILLQRSRTRLFGLVTAILSLGITGFTSIILFKEQIIALLSR